MYPSTLLAQIAEKKDPKEIELEVQKADLDLLKKINEIAASAAVVGTAASLYAKNPTPGVGQIAYETDTLSFKIGDGSTAYNSLTYFYRGLPVAGEPSLGTPHALSDANRSTTALVDTATNTGGVWSAAVTITTAPAGAKAAWCLTYIVGAGRILAVEAASGYTLSDITTANNYRKYWCNRASAGDGWAMLKVHLDSSRQFKWCTSVTSSTVMICAPVDYDC